MTAASHRRWYRLTPDRCVLGLLALEAFLLLSAWFEWFAFNQNKGWAALITVEIVGVSVLLIFLWFLAALVFRWRFQYGIRSLLLLVVVVAVPFSWLATEREAAGKQREAVDAIVKAGGWVVYDNEFDLSGNRIPEVTPPGPRWLCRLLGDDLFGNVWSVGFIHIIHLAGSFTIQPFTPEISDAGLKRIEELPHVRWLRLDYTKISNAGLEHVKGLTTLQSLNLNGTKISDGGLQHLKGLTHLQVLDLRGTEVTDSGVQNLRQSLPSCVILH